MQPIAAELAGELADSAPWTTGASHQATVSAWSWAEAQCAVLRTWLDEQGLLDAKGEPRPATTLLDRCEKRAAGLRAELGLSPLALARLLSTVSSLSAETANTGLDALRAEGRRIVEARAAALEAPGSAPGAASGPPAPDGDDHAPAPVSGDLADGSDDHDPLDHEETTR